MHLKKVCNRYRTEKGQRKKQSRSEQGRRAKSCENKSTMKNSIIVTSVEGSGVTERRWERLRTGIIWKPASEIQKAAEIFKRPSDGTSIGLIYLIFPCRNKSQWVKDLYLLHSLFPSTSWKRRKMEKRREENRIQSMRKWHILPGRDETMTSCSRPDPGFMGLRKNYLWNHSFNYQQQY